jgi:transcriptional regulator with XRE-family HTH domain
VQPYERVRQIRISKGIMSSYVAEQLGLSASAYSAIEHGKRPLRVELIVPLARVLGVSPGEFFVCD